ncbi:hypothetical protein [Terrabacter sp. Soil810]|uniref:hypothetical protein n=1 Tax=Terrabacter sp. Soil810 TaxID=1736418 RepID=UPI0012F75142|nr:hypothetical protein [Terrabacter sp. Soil810]
MSYRMWSPPGRRPSGKTVPLSGDGRRFPDAGFGAVAASGLAWWAASAHPWLTIASVTWLLLAADQFRLGRAGAHDPAEAP